MLPVRHTVRQAIEQLSTVIIEWGKFLFLFRVHGGILNSWAVGKTTGITSEPSCFIRQPY